MVRILRFNFFSTQAYFTMYHSLTNVLQRVFDSLVLKHIRNFFLRAIFYWTFIFALAFITAYMETYVQKCVLTLRFTIQRFPYYVHKDKQAMYLYGMYEW